MDMDAWKAGIPREISLNFVLQLRSFVSTANESRFVSSLTPPHTSCTVKVLFKKTPPNESAWQRDVRSKRDKSREGEREKASTGEVD